MRRRPYQVILFDEVEKAHEDVFNILLQVLDDGRLTDGQGRTVDFRNTLIVLTSNLGAEALAALADGEDVDRARGQVMAAVRALLPPEFLNRLDEIVLFRRLARADMGKIVDIQIGRLRKLLADRKIEIVLDDVRARLAGRGRLRPGVRRPSAEAGDPAHAAGPAGGDAAGRQRARGAEGGGGGLCRRAGAAGRIVGGKVGGGV